VSYSHIRNIFSVLVLDLHCSLLDLLGQVARRPFVILACITQPLSWTRAGTGHSSGERALPGRQCCDNLAARPGSADYCRPKRCTFRLLLAS
jgi:hypothetical protein